MANNSRPTYTDAGFNGFLRRSISSNINNNTLAQISRNSSSVSNINFDNINVSGSLGDTITVGNITIDGSVGNGRIDGHDESNNTVWRLGDLES